MIQQHLEAQLTAEFKPDYLAVINESHQHSGEASESHFKLIVVSQLFKGMTLIGRHRAINRLLKEELNHIHALAMHTYTPEEWQLKQSAPDSPMCRGGSE